jgi:hypothetical protein
MQQWDGFIASIAILNEAVGNEVHAVATPRQRTRSKKEPWGVWGSDCDRALDPPPPFYVR